MRITTIISAVVLAIGTFLVAPAHEGAPPPIEQVRVGSQREFRVNGRPFFPLVAWLQDAKNFEAIRACGMNTTAGYWPGSSGTQNIVQYMQLVQQAGLYGVLPFDPLLVDHPNLLGYIHDDEPDLPQLVSDAEIIPADHLALNRRTPLWRMVDGVTHSWSVLDPLADASVTIVLPEPVSADSVAVWLTISGDLSVAKEVAFVADGREILVATLKAERGQQKFSLSETARFQQLKMTVRSVHPGQVAYGSIGEIEAFDRDGRNVLLSPPRYEPRAWPDATLEQYRAIRSADPSRPVWMTLTGNFHPHFDKWSDEQRDQLYPAYLQAADVIGYDIYPIYGWNKPEWLHLVHEATERLTAKAGSRPVYAWIETSRGGQWTGPLERQHDVLPEHIRAQVWMAICRGATAIGYFTHVWKPSYHQFGVPEQNRQAIRQINDQITRLTPAILAPPPKRDVAIHPETEARLDVMARQHDGHLYLFAVNFDPRRIATRARIAIEGLADGHAISVVDEDRRLSAEAGGFTDTFEPLEVHIYRMELAD